MLRKDLRDDVSYMVCIQQASVNDRLVLVAAKMREGLSVDLPTLVAIEQVEGVTLHLASILFCNSASLRRSAVSGIAPQGRRNYDKVR